VKNMTTKKLIIIAALIEAMVLIPIIIYAVFFK